MAPGHNDATSSRSRADHGHQNDRLPSAGATSGRDSAGQDVHNHQSRDSERAFFDSAAQIGHSDFAGPGKRGGAQALHPISSGDQTPTSASPIKGTTPTLPSRRRMRRGKKVNAVAKLTWQDRLRDRIGVLWQAVVVETILRQKPLAASKDGRQIPLNPDEVGPKGLTDERREKPYINNFIRSNRYTLWTFIPAQLIYQFSKLGNFYFLVVAIVQMIPGLSTVGRWTTIAPLGAFVAFSMLKEGYDDWRRYELDKTENRSVAWVLASGVRSNESNRPKRFSGKGWKKGETEREEKRRRDVEKDAHVRLETGDWIKVQWQHVQVGDIVRLHRDDGVPADIALLHATGPNGIAYIDTMALDGETNLKSKQASPLFTERCGNSHGLKTTKATVVSEDPNLDLYSYDGKASVDGETLPLTMANVVYRGSTLRNTSMAIGLVVNSGEECKIRMNANKNTRAKKPRMQSAVNRIILVQILALLLLSAGMTVGYYLWKNPTEEEAFYIREPSVYNATVPFAEIFFGYVIMYNTLIPLSLYISLEIVKIGQFLLMQDAEMYDPLTDTPFVINTTSILENLGQVDYVFSDKTGTLTENIMRFRKMSVAGVPLLHDMDLDKDEEIKQKKIEATEKKKSKTKGKAKAFLPGALSRVLQEHDDENAEQHPIRPTPSRRSTGMSASQWQESTMHDEPEMKTEDLLDILKRKPNTTFARQAKWFLLCIALCHTCLPETTDDGRLAFQAANPDELALIEAARDFGYLMTDRPTNAIKLQTTNVDGSTHVETYTVLDVIEFSSKRKRMSIIVRMPDGRICVICKGADNVIRERLTLQDLAAQKAADIGQRASQRRSMEQGRAKQRQSQDLTSPRSSLALSRRDSNFRQTLSRRSTEIQRLVEENTPRSSMDRPPYSRMQSYQSADELVDNTACTTEAITFERCFQHVDDFASEGLRTLLYGYRFIDERGYKDWKEIYHEAETSLDDRQERIEEASDLIEQKFDLAGATAIEDKLQEGVPDTIDKLRRANIKVWMLTGDKRETAINIGHSARLCKPFSQTYILDKALGDLQEQITNVLEEIIPGDIPHAVLVVDGGTLADIDNNGDIAKLFYDLVIMVDSVICCRASPAQKANLVKTIRRFVPKSMTLAIGDGANDIGMILASHVGVGVSGREGLQAARVSDFSIAQFRFLQKLLFVHGRWNYIRTGKYVLATFWKEILFYLVQAHFQRWNGYSGTSLYENWSLTVFNVLFTSLAVIVPGIFEKDLSADTLLAVPELYTFGQKGLGFNYYQYFGWALMGSIGSVIIYYPTWAYYRYILFTSDNSLFAMGCVCFTVAVVFINIKLFILECHSKSLIIFGCFALSVGGWFMWMCVISQTYSPTMAIYLVNDGFLHNFGPTLSWWTIILLELAALLVLDLSVQSIRRVYFPNDVDLMQRIEKDAAKKSAKGGEKDIDVEMQDVEAVETRYTNDVPGTHEPTSLTRESTQQPPPSAANRDTEAQSTAGIGNADHYYSNVDPRPPQATHQQPGNAI